MKKWLEIKLKKLRKPKNQSNGMTLKKINSLKLNLKMKKKNKILTFKIKTILIPMTKLILIILFK